MYPNHGLGDQIKECFDHVIIYDVPGLTLKRLGSINDGGYVIALPTAETDLVAIGVGGNTDFEQQFLTINGSPSIYLFDPFIEDFSPPPPFSFFPLLARLVDLSLFKRNSVLKVDIEGDEWDFFGRNTIDDLTRFSQIICEFHFLTLSPKGDLSPYFYSVYQRFCDQQNKSLFWTRSLILQKLMDRFTPYHIHANNSLPLETLDGVSFPPLIEVSMIRNDLAKGRIKTEKRFPLVGFDTPNKTDRPDITGWWPICS